MFKKYLENLYIRAAELNHRNILDLLERDEDARFLDLGCDDGIFSLKMAGKIGTKNVYGVEIVEERMILSQEKGILTKNFDLNGGFDFENNFFDAIVANQVIEHLSNSDNFISEIYRILKPGGYAVISTENASSWCNIFASIMGWQIFSLTNFSSKKQGIGNPFSLHRGENSNLDSWNHVRIYNIRGLREYFEAFDFKIEKTKGAGYFPLSSDIGNLDKTHSHFMAFKIRK